jgi:hypothetical protein
MKSPTTSTEQILANASYGVSSTRGSEAVLAVSEIASALAATLAPEIAGEGVFASRSVFFVILSAL